MSGWEKEWRFSFFGWGVILHFEKKPGDISLVFVMARAKPEEYTPDPKPVEEREPPKLRSVG
jgi:hypothetical protein